ncbi:hemerythrin domain-containing protein [Clostridiaceae bacterium 35-E11]
MNAIELMMQEHKNIKRILLITRELCIKILDGLSIDYDIFYQIIDFVRNYADQHHHNKEEAVLFKQMSEELGEVIEKGPIMGMFAEHDLGRLFISNLENALKKVQAGDKEARVDVIANAIAYTDLLHRHIDKEDTAIYTFAQKRLSKEAMKKVENQCQVVELEARNQNIQEKYLQLIEDLEKKIK